MKISEIKAQLNENPTESFIDKLRTDPRKGVQQALQSYFQRKKREQEREAAFEQRLRYERSFWNQGINLIAGIDEVGRGPLAGPVVSAAVILPHDFHVVDVNDSKQLSEKKREKLYQVILEQAVAVGIGMADAAEIDKLNIYQATRKAMLQAVQNLQIVPQQLIIDAMEIKTTIPQLKLIKGDAKSASVSAASIVAKEFRDHLMRFYDRIYPNYDFAHNVGYGTAKHILGLKKCGISPIHRQSFEPVSKFK